jgi:hypothetical protein
MTKGGRPKSLHGRGEIRADALYPVGTFTRRLGIGRHSLTALRRQGLPVRSIGQRLFVDGMEALAFLRNLWSATGNNQTPISNHTGPV